MPKLWNATIETHRREVHEAILDTTSALVAEQGLRSVTMSRIAEETGIGRATLYKYFPDVEAILAAWHERQISRHLDQLARARDRATTPGERLHDVLEAYALISREWRGHHEDIALAALLHRHERVAQAARRLHGMIRELVLDGAGSGDVRRDVEADELATYCLHALNAAHVLPSAAAVLRLVAVVMAGLRPPH